MKVIRQQLDPDGDVEYFMQLATITVRLRDCIDRWMTCLHTKMKRALPSRTRDVLLEPESALQLIVDPSRSIEVSTNRR